MRYFMILVVWFLGFVGSSCTMFGASFEDDLSYYKGVYADVQTILLACKYYERAAMSLPQYHATSAEIKRVDAQIAELEKEASQSFVALKSRVFASFSPRKYALYSREELQELLRDSHKELLTYALVRITGVNYNCTDPNFRLLYSLKISQISQELARLD